MTVVVSQASISLVVMTSPAGDVSPAERYAASKRRAARAAEFPALVQLGAAGRGRRDHPGHRILDLSQCAVEVEEHGVDLAGRMRHAVHITERDGRTGHRRRRCGTFRTRTSLDP